MHDKPTYQLGLFASGSHPGVVLRRVVSGGQTGVDRGALDAAIQLRIEHGGWCPRGRIAEDGPLPSSYQLVETESDQYPERTERNVVDSDGTLILFRGKMSGGTELTFRLTGKHDRPSHLVDLTGTWDLAGVRNWLAFHKIEVLNVAGPRESSASGVYEQAYLFILELLGSERSSGSDP